ncbi:MAG: ribosomal L7Ae/L30e/S12e/Gadd45 family protein [Clostridia bacterium]
MDDLSDCIVGTKQVQKAILASAISKVYLACDVDEKLKNNIQALCLEKNIEIESVSTMLNLGKLCNIDVGAACAGVKCDGKG